MEKIGYYNGTVGPLDQMQIPLLDRASFFGDGVYDATITSEGVILYEQDHIDRFYNSAAIVGMELPFTKEWLAETLREMVAKCDANDTFLYWQVTRGTDFRHHNFPDVEPNLWITVEPHEPEDLSWDYKLITFEDKRFSYCNAKTLNLLPNVLAAQATKEAGCDESIFVRDGIVTECAHSNVHILAGGKLITHPLDSHILPGVARKHLVAMCKKLGIGVEERCFTVDELMAADEVIVTASSTFARGVKEIDGKPVGGKDRATLELLQRELTAEFDEYIDSHKQA